MLLQSVRIVTITGLFSLFSLFSSNAYLNAMNPMKETAFKFHLRLITPGTKDSSLKSPCPHLLSNVFSKARAS